MTQGVVKTFKRTQVSKFQFQKTVVFPCVLGEDIQSAQISSEYVDSSAIHLNLFLVK